MSLLIGRLDRESARGILASAATLADAELSEQLPLRPENVTYSPVGGTRVSEGELATLRKELLSVAREHGYPGTSERLSSFESRLARILHHALPMTANEAAQEEVWTYLTCCWLLDLAFWRFGRDADERRFIGNVNRNTFRRLWWRAEILGPDIPLDALGEDELVNIMERPTLAADRRLARAIATEFLAHVSLGGSTERMQLMREAMKRLMRLTPFVSFQALPTRDVNELVHTAFAGARASLAGELVRLPEQPSAVAPPVSPDVTRVEIATTGTSSASASDAASVIGYEDEAAAAAIAIAERTGAVTNIMLRETTSLTSAEAREVLMRLVDMGVLARRGVRRGTHYVISRPADNPTGEGRSLHDEEADTTEEDSSIGKEETPQPDAADQPSRLDPSTTSASHSAVPPPVRPELHRRRGTTTERLDRIGVLVGGAVSRRRAPNVAQAERVLEVLRETPGLAIPEIATQSKLNMTYLYGVLPQLEREGKVRKVGRFWYPY